MNDYFRTGGEAPAAGPDEVPFWDNQFDHQYNYWLRRIMDEGERRDDRTKTGTISMFGDVNMKFDLRRNFPAITGKRLAFKTMKIETIDWMLKGKTDLKTLKELGVGIWDLNVKPGTEVYEGPELTLEQRVALLTDQQKKTFGEFQENFRKEAEKWSSTSEQGILNSLHLRLNNWGVPDRALSDGYLGPIYGKQWRAHDDVRVIPASTLYNPDKARDLFARGFEHTGFENQTEIVIRRQIDQIALIETALKNEVLFHQGKIEKHSAGRRIILTGWNVAQLDEMQLPPCHTLAQFYVSSNTDEHGQHFLDCKLFLRSNDIFLGMPFNVAQYAMITEMLAHTHGLRARYFHVTEGDAHIYANHVDQVRKQLARPIIYKAPTLKIDRRIRSTSVLDIQTKDVELIGYESYDSIKAPIAGN
uniref:thymidylate synthase n=1 Tax=Pseudomonas phage HRDY3 TaxID=3236930 RepID=A0AB39CDR9_9VIRU